MKNREDMNKYKTSSTMVVRVGRSEGELAKTAGATFATIGNMIWKTVKTVLLIVMITGMTVAVSVGTYILSFRDINTPNIGTMKLNYSSFVYVMNNSGEYEEYMKLSSPGEDRVWAGLEKIPKNMVNAIIAIEDKRFMQHHGVDWQTTAKSVVQLMSDDGGGGSTLTQQLIKNLTGDKDVSIMRKVKEIFRALNLEEKYSKDEILEAYLNVVDFGSGTKGVEAAAQLYFGKSITDCDLAECAAIAGITQYPVKYSPLNNPEENNKRQNTILDEMYDQNLVTKAEYDEAKEKAKNMQFVGFQQEDFEEEEMEESEIWNWYIETMISDLVRDLAEYEGVSEETASDMLYRSGYKIYSSMIPSLQEEVETLFKQEDVIPSDPSLLFGVYVMDYTGRTLAVVGARGDKTNNLVTNFTTDEPRQTGSTMKPIGAYAPSVEAGEITYGSLLVDNPIPGYFDDGDAGPYNYDRSFSGWANLDYALEVSLNAPAAHTVTNYTPQATYEFLTQKLGLTSLNDIDRESVAALSLGGLNRGVTVREMAGAYQVFGNGGVYNRPFTYYYVRNHDGDVILDNQNKQGVQAMSTGNAAVMNMLLHRPIFGPNGTAGYSVQIDGVDMYGKTGTTDLNYNVWFCGGTPFAVGAVWSGYKSQKTVDEHRSNDMWRSVMQYIYENYQLSDSGYKVEGYSEIVFCRSSGLIAGGSCYDTALGYYADDNIPRSCNGGSDHKKGGGKASGTAAPDTTATPDPNATTTPDPNETQGPDVSGSESSNSSGPDDSPTPNTPEPPPPVSSPPPSESPSSEEPSSSNIESSEEPSSETSALTP